MYTYTYDIVDYDQFQIKKKKMFNNFSIRYVNNTITVEWL